MVVKLCKQCNLSKDINLFHNKKSGKNGKHSRCGKCVNSNGKAYYQEHIEEYRAKKRKPVTKGPVQIVSQIRIVNGIRTAKRCIKCTAIKLLRDFHKQGHGLSATCASCTNENRRVNRAKQKLTK